MKLGYYLLTLNVYDRWFDHKGSAVYYFRTKVGALNMVKRYKNLFCGIDILDYTIEKV